MNNNASSRLAMSDSSSRFKFGTSNRHQLAREILSHHLTYDPHDYQLEGICQILDGLDLLAVVATGSGKTGYFSMYMLMLLELSKNPALSKPEYHGVPDDPAMIVLYPTVGLEEEQEVTFTNLGLKTLVINADRLHQARKRGSDLWTQARTGVSMILMSPEQLTSKGLELLLENSSFQRRICALGLDEVHLLDSWGTGFREAFLQIGFIRARFPRQTRLIGTTATLLAGRQTENICKLLGLHHGEFYFLRRSNVRHNVRMIFRTPQAGLSGWSFPDLQWILESGRKTVIHCPTIMLGFRLAIYLWHLCPASSDRAKRIRLYNALNWPSYNAQTRELMRNDPEAQIIIATAAFMVGVDLPNIQDVVSAGHLLNANDHFQWDGRPGRDPWLVRDAHFITYLTTKTISLARTLCDGKEPRGEKKTVGGKRSGVQMDISMARLIVADCKIAEQDVLYDNPPLDSLCSCSGCVTNPPPPPPVTCTCSGCMPEDLPMPVLVTKRKAINPIPSKLRLTKLMRAEGIKRLHELRWSIYNSTDTAASRFLPPDAFLPETTVKMVLDRFALIEDKNSLQEMIKTRVYLALHLDMFWDVIQELRGHFEEMREQKRCEKKAQKDDSAGGVGESEDSDDECVGGPSITWKSDNELVGGTIATQSDESFRCALVQWNLNDPSAVQVTSASPTHKRSRTISTLNPRPRAKQRITDKENHHTVD